MYKIGDHVVYGSNGVCLVTDVCASPFDKKDERTYYVLKPVSGARSSVIYTPVGNPHVLMRPLMDAAALDSLLLRVDEIPLLEVPNEKSRREAYRTVIASGQLEALVALIKTVMERRVAFSGTQRRLPEFEMEYDGQARRHLFAELSLVLGRPTEELSRTLFCGTAEAAI